MEDENVFYLASAALERAKPVDRRKQDAIKVSQKVGETIVQLLEDGNLYRDGQPMYLDESHYEDTGIMLGMIGDLIKGYVNFHFSDSSGKYLKRETILFQSMIELWRAGQEHGKANSN